MSSAALGVIDDARGRQQRRIGVLAVVAACATVAVAFAVGAANGPHGRTADATAIRVEPAVLFARAPYAGVACQTRACDSVGLAVWLRRPALSVTATIAKHSFDLTTASARPFANPWQAPRRMLVGYLTPLPLVTHSTVGGGPPVSWPAPNDPDPLVSLRVNEGGGRSS